MKRPNPRLRTSVPMTIIGVALAASLAGASMAGAATTQGGGPFSGASGSVAAISGSSLEVQNQQSGQVTVNWSSSTTISQTVTVAASSLSAGECVTVNGSSSKGTITARTVTISQPSSGKCTTTSGFGGGRAGSGSPTGGFTRPSGASGSPAGGFTRPSGSSGSRPGGFGGSGNIGFATGTVKAMTANNLVVSGFSSASIAKSATKASTSSSKKRPTVKTTTVKVKLASSTTFTENQAAAASNLAVGDCVTAAGSSDSTGAVTAATIRITSTGGNSCTTGFGFGGGTTSG